MQHLLKNEHINPIDFSLS